MDMHVYSAVCADSTLAEIFDVLRYSNPADHRHWLLSDFWLRASMVSDSVLIRSVAGHGLQSRLIRGRRRQAGSLQIHAS